MSEKKQYWNIDYKSADWTVVYEGKGKPITLAEAIQATAFYISQHAKRSGSYKAAISNQNGFTAAIVSVSLFIPDGD